MGEPQARRRLGTNSAADATLTIHLVAKQLKTGGLEYFLRPSSPFR
jgi:hypothetical protein